MLAAAMVAATLAVAAVAVVVAVTSLATAAETLAAMVAVAVAVHARMLATHKVAVSQPSHACNKRRLHASAHSRLTKMPNQQAMSLQASRLPASRRAATAATTAAVAAVVALVVVVVVAAVDVQAAAKAVPVTSARSTVVNRPVPYDR